MRRKFFVVFVVGMLILAAGCTSYSVVTYSRGMIEVNFIDKNLETIMREAVGKPEGVVFDTDLEILTTIYAPRRNIRDLTGMEYCVNLGYVSLNHNLISDITPLTKLQGGTAGIGESSYSSLCLGLAYNQITDISSLVKLAGVGELHLFLSGNKIEDFSPLSKLTNLVTLYLVDTGISDVTPLAGLTNLAILDLQCNPVHDISPLNNLTAEIFLSS